MNTNEKEKIKSNITEFESNISTTISTLSTWDKGVVAATIALVIIGFSAFIFSAEIRSKVDYISFITGLVPLIQVAILYGRRLEDKWQDSLPKYLTANYYYNGKKRLSIAHIILANEQEVRSQALTITKMFLNNDKTNFPTTTFLSKSPQKNNYQDLNKIVNNGKPFALFIVDIDLKVDITEIDKETLNDNIKKRTLEMQDNSYLYIEYPFKNDQLEIK